MDRGERIVSRTKTALKNALTELLREKNYPDITVGEIAKRGNIGRSTLYKHYNSKADVLLDIHKDVFEHLFSGLQALESWCASEPPAELIAFFERYRKLGRNPFSLSYKMGSDLDYLMSNVNIHLANTIEDKLRNAHKQGWGNIPLPVLAQAIANLYGGLIMYWFHNLQSSDIRQFATNLHRMARALILEAVRENTI